MRHRGAAAYVWGALALGELAGDLHPGAPARTRAVGLTARIVSGAFCGSGGHHAAAPSIAAGVVLGIAGALCGAYGGLAVRTRAMAAIGRRSGSAAGGRGRDYRSGRGGRGPRSDLVHDSDPAMSAAVCYSLLQNACS